jgi:hypothetical protein
MARIRRGLHRVGVHWFCRRARAIDKATVVSASSTGLGFTVDESREIHV